MGTPSDGLTNLGQGIVRQDVLNRNDGQELTRSEKSGAWDQLGDKRRHFWMPMERGMVRTRAWRGTLEPMPAPETFPTPNERPVRDTATRRC